MNSIPDAWVDRLFNVMSEIYSDKWNNFYGKNNKIDTFKRIWKSALHGLSADQIKIGIDVCKERLRYTIPTPVEFYHYCKGLPVVKDLESPAQKKDSMEYANKHLDSIFDLLKIKRK